MTSAALLEDLFVDASINFRNSHRREVEISRPERAAEGEEANSKGVKGWDYQFQGEHFSHKVGKGINAIALLWDATVKLPEDKKWNYESTMVYVLSSYRRANANLLLSDSMKIQISSVLNFRNRPIKSNQAVLICERISRKKWKVREVVKLEEGSDIHSVLPLDAIWEKMIGNWAKTPANKWDVFITQKPIDSKVEIPTSEEFEFDFEAHPGIYVFEKEKLQGIEVTQNNRAVLLPATTVGDLAQQSAEDNMFVFMPSWYMAYAENRPADLYLAQKQEFELLNSASRRR